jgi:hypothetical protein
MIFSNVDHVRNEELRRLSREASSLYLFGGAAFWKMLAHIEKGELVAAADVATEAASFFERAVPVFYEVARRAGADAQFQERVRKVDLYAAAQSVLVDTDQKVIQSLQRHFARGAIYDVFENCAMGIRAFADLVREFRNQLRSSHSAGSEPDFEFVHQRLVRGWTEFTVFGQYVSAVCLLAGEGPPHALAMG